MDEREQRKIIIIDKIKRCYKPLCIKKMTGSGRKARSNDPSLHGKVFKSISKNRDLSQRDLAKKFETSKCNVLDFRSARRKSCGYMTDVSSILL